MADEKIDMAYMVKNGKMTEKEVSDYLNDLQKELMDAKYEPVVDFQAIFVPDTYSRAGLIIPQLLYHDIDKDVLKLGTSMYNSNKLIEIAQDNADGIVFVDGFFKDSSDEVVSSFVLKFKDTFQAEPTILESEAYDCTKIIITLIQEQGIIDRESLKKAMDGINNYKGVTGIVRSFNNGEADENLNILTIKKGKINQAASVGTP